MASWVGCNSGSVSCVGLVWSMDWGGRSGWFMGVGLAVGRMGWGDELDRCVGWLVGWVGGVVWRF